MTSATRILALTALLTGVARAQTSLVTNGSFEAGPAIPSQGYLPLGPGNGILPGWEITNGQIDYVAGGFIAASEGLRSLDMNGSPGAGGVKQVVPTQAGHDYVVLFDLWRNPGGNFPTGASLSVEAAAVQESFVSIGSDGWTARGMPFTALGATTEVELLTQVPVGIAGPMLDRVEVYESLGGSTCAAVPNSTGEAVDMYAIGSAAVADDELSLVAVNLADQSFAYFLVSQSTANVPLVGGGQGTLCLGGAIGRFNQQIQNALGRGTVRIDVDLTALPMPGGPVAVQPGETWYFQLWYRDNNPAPTSNLSDAVSVTFS